ncbi:COMM domain [Trinorchestia longiramus]|nr:COMM domain [Trinorchestia longiramus]
MVQTIEHSPDFSWLVSAGITHDQFALESVVKLSCLGFQDADDAEKTEQQQLCRRYLQQYACRVVEKKLSLQQCEAALGACGFSGAAVLHAAATEHSPAIRTLLLHRALAPLPGLADFDWNVRLAVSSSRVATLQEPLLNLVLRTTPTSASGEGDDTKPTSLLSSGASAMCPGDGASSPPTTAAVSQIFAELNLEQVHELIAGLKAAQHKMLKCT